MPICQPVELVALSTALTTPATTNCLHEAAGGGVGESSMLDTGLGFRVAGITFDAWDDDTSRATLAVVPVGDVLNFTVTAEPCPRPGPMFAGELASSIRKGTPLTVQVVPPSFIPADCTAGVTDATVPLKRIDICKEAGGAGRGPPATLAISLATRGPEANVRVASTLTAVPTVGSPRKVVLALS